MVIVASLTLVFGCRDPEPTAAPVVEQTLVYGRGADSVGLDPALEEDGESFKVAELLFDTLVQYADRSTDIEPGLATSWENSDDRLTWTFHLREGVTFHDGTPFNAASVVFSLKRQYDTSHPAHGIGGQYLYWISLGLDDIIESVSEVDAKTVRITLKRPYAPLLSMLAIPPFSIISPTTFAAKMSDFKFEPVGTGPFKFVEWRRDDRIALRRNDSYWGGKPTLDKIVFRAIPDNAARLLEIEQGNIQVLENPDPENLPTIRANASLKVYEQAGMNVGYLAMNFDHKPLDDVRVRRAINYAINKQAIVDGLYGGTAVVAKNPIPPTIWGYNDAVQDVPYDPDAAKALLKEAFPNGFPRALSLYVMPNPRDYFPSPQNIGLAIQSDLAKVGITANIRTVEWGTYLEQVKQGDHDLGMLGWIADYGDPDNFLYFLLSKENATPPAGNIAFYRSDELTNLLVQAQQEADQAKRADLYKQAQVIVRRDLPWVTIAHANKIMVTTTKVENFILHPTTTRTIWKARLAGN